MTHDHFRFAKALAIEKQRGEKAALYIAERIRALALAGDAEGVTRFREIANRLDIFRTVQRHGNA